LYVDDVAKSPTIGYIKMSDTSTNTQANGNTTGLANPFASKDKIDAKIKKIRR